MDRFRTSGGRLGIVVGATALSVGAAAAVGAAASSVAAAVATYLAAVLAPVAALALRAASMFRAQTVALLDTRPPQVTLGRPQVVEGIGVRDLQGRWIHDAVFVVIPIVNDPEGTTAEHVHATIQVETLDGSPLTAELPARWQATEQVGASTEATIFANGRPHNIETVMCFAGTDESYVWNNESRASADAALGPKLPDRFRLDADDFLVWVSVMGSNLSRMTAPCRVQRTASTLRVVPIDAERLA